MEAFDMQAAKKNLEKRLERKRAENDARFEQASRDFQKIVNHIIDKYHPARIYQWGSLLNQAKFTEMSDIDIAVEGIASAEAFFALFGEVDDMTDFPMDLVEMEHIDPLHAESIRKKGRLVYER